MRERIRLEVQAQQKSSPGLLSSRIPLQSTCACGQHCADGTECTECRNKRLALQGTLDEIEFSLGLPTMQNGASVQENASPSDFTVDRKTHFGHDFSRVAIHSTERAVRQNKLAVSKPGDAYEQEADQVADQVMRTEMPEHEKVHSTFVVPRAMQRCSCEDDDDDEKKHMARKETKGVVDIEYAAPLINSVVDTGGQPLASNTRAFMEPRFGHDFSKVRIHDNTRASESAEAVNALAYTVGPHIVFRSGQFAPDTTQGKRILAHELTHVVQQQGSTSLARAASNEEATSTNSSASPGQGESKATKWLLTLIAGIERIHQHANRHLAANAGTATAEQGTHPEAQQHLSTVSDGLEQLRAVAAGDDEVLKLRVLSSFDPNMLEQAETQTMAPIPAVSEAPLQSAVSIDEQRPEGVAMMSYQVSHPQDPAEVEAERVATAIVSDSPISTIQNSSSGTVHRFTSEAAIALGEALLVADAEAAPIEATNPVGWAIGIGVAVVAVGIIVTGVVMASSSSTPTTTAPATTATTTTTPTTRSKNQTCDDVRLDALQQAMHAICDSIPGESCSPSKVSPKRLDRRPCSEIRLRIQAMQACLQARQQIQDECFANGPDLSDPESIRQYQIHQDAINQVQNGIAACRTLEAVNCAPGHPMANL